MLDSITWVISLVSAFLGMAGTIVLGAAAVALIWLAKKLPIGVRRLISVFAANIVVFTFFRDFALQTAELVTWRYFIIATFSFRGEVALLMSAAFLLFGDVLFCGIGRATGEGRLPAVRDEKYRACRSELSFSPSFIKTSTVLRQ